MSNQVFLNKGNPTRKKKLRTLRRELTSIRNEPLLKLKFFDIHHLYNSFTLRSFTLKHKQVNNKNRNNLRLTSLKKCSHEFDKVICTFLDDKLTIPFHLIIVWILCCPLSFCFTILRAKIYQFVKLNLLNQKFEIPHCLPLIVSVTTK